MERINPAVHHRHVHSLPGRRPGLYPRAAQWLHGPAGRRRAPGEVEAVARDPAVAGGRGGPARVEIRVKTRVGGSDSALSNHFRRGVGRRACSNVGWAAGRGVGRRAQWGGPSPPRACSNIKDAAIQYGKHVTQSVTEVSTVSITFQVKSLSA